MKDFARRAAEAPERLPEEMQEAAVAYLYGQGEKFRRLKALAQEGVDDVAAMRVSPFDMNEIRALALEIRKKDPSA